MKKVFSIFLLVILTSLFTMPVGAAGNTPLSMPVTFFQFDDPVEQQSPDWHYGDNGYNVWQCTHDGTYEEYQSGGGINHPDNCVHNPLAGLCTWDVDDQTVNQGSGAVAANTTVTGTTCNIADFDYVSGGFAGDPLFIDVFVSAPKPDLTVGLTNTSGVSISISPTKVGNEWQWKYCGRMYDWGPYAEIPNSNGGFGKRVDWTVSITAGTRAVKPVFAVLQTTGGIISYWNICTHN